MNKLKLPFFGEHYVGFTIPTRGTFYVCDHDAVWLVTLGTEPTVQETDLNPYEFVEGRTDFLGLVFDGLQENAPLLSVGDNAITYDFDPTAERVVVTYDVAGHSGEIDFEIWTHSWFSSSLSDDGCHLILAEPDEIAVYETGL